ncbi:hypothetical protein [Roseibium sp. RKSG952]|uniref:hypothetical protein n=1 Tax=Roseibium sp. RKSG952 TaxID=2529384 RepID=UPI0012BBE4C0|nr:hypothetical protein [Roseibium sp. RKSG952]MTH95034.1 hypothetical protein [Roseibium sp. RKSG952]
MASVVGNSGFALGGMGGILEQAVRHIDDLSGARLSRLLSTTSLVNPADLPFEDYGFIVAAGSRPLPIASHIRDIAIFTVEEARERISDFIENRFSPDSISELLEYLHDKFLDIETRILPNGIVANYIVDQKTKKSVPAALVDERFSHKRMLALKLRSATKEIVPPGMPPADALHSWEGLKMTFENNKANVGYTVFEDQAYLGRVHAVAGSDMRENMEIIRRAKNRGVDLIVPVMKDGTNGPNVIVAGMPFLEKANSLKAEEIHPGLSHAALSKAFGMGMPQTFMRMAAAMKARSADEIESKEQAMAAMRQFMRKKDAPADVFVEVDDRAVGFAAATRDTDNSDYVIRRVGGSDPYLYVYDASLEEEPGFAVTSLAEGRYKRQTESGYFEGYTDVFADGQLRHFDRKGNHCVPVRDDPEAEREMREALTPGMGV